MMCTGSTLRDVITNSLKRRAESRLTNTCALLLLLATGSTERAVIAEPLSASKVRTLLQNMQMLQPMLKKSINSTYSGSFCSVHLQRPSDASKEDCKIDAVLITRELSQADKDLKLVQCMFMDPNNSTKLWEVKVPCSLVTAFGEGTIGKRTLLNSLITKEREELPAIGQRYKKTSYKEILEEESVYPGPYYERRLAVSLTLKNLDAQRIDTEKFKSEFLRLEDATRRSNTKNLEESIDKLDNEIEQRVQALVAAGQLPKPSNKESTIK